MIKKTIYVIKHLWVDFCKWFSEYWDSIALISGFTVLAVIPCLPAPIPMVCAATVILLGVAILAAFIVAAIIAVGWVLVDKIKKILKTFPDK